MNTYDVFTGNDLVIAEKIQQRRYQLLIHSCIYYHLNQNIIPDYQWDKWAKELVQLQKSYPNISKQVKLYDAFKDWDGSTGAFLPITDDWVIKKVQSVFHIKAQTLDNVNKQKSNKSSKNKRKLF